MSIRHARLSTVASSIPQSLCSLLGMGEAVMPSCMPEEAHCQEDRGINAETRYVFHFSMCIFALIVFARFFIGYFTLSNIC